MESIRVLETYEVRRMDSLNWRVWQYKVLKGGERKGESDWVPLDSYHGTLASAIEWIAKNAPKELHADVETDLKGAIELIREIERDMAEHAREFTKAAR